MKIMFLGDTHGNSNFIINAVIPHAQDAEAEWIYQVGDFGYWEHTEDGEKFLDLVNRSLAFAQRQFLFIKGNHDKVSLIPDKYYKVDGFYKIRSNIWYAEDGLVWRHESAKTTFMALGGAYSIDKKWRLENEKLLGKPQTLWFPEEEMSDTDLDSYLDAVTQKVDILLCHDKPHSSTVLGLKDIDLCVPNQMRIQKAITRLKPEMVIHGHLHRRYSDVIRSGGDSFTQVEGLGADISDNWQEESWFFLDV